MTENEYKLGTKVKLISVYLSLVYNLKSNVLIQYINRYKPQNAFIKIKDNIPYVFINDGGCGSRFDLSKRKDLTWKIVYKYPIIKKDTYLIRSNENHILLLNKVCFRIINNHTHAQ